MIATLFSIPLTELNWIAIFIKEKCTYWVFLLIVGSAFFLPDRTHTVYRKNFTRWRFHTAEQQCKLS